MYLFEESSSFSAYSLASAGDGAQAHLVSLYLYTTSASLLSSLSVTARWNDGLSAKSRTETLLLASLLTYSVAVFPVMLAPHQSFTIEAALSGGASYGIGVSLAGL